MHLIQAGMNKLFGWRRRIATGGVAVLTMLLLAHVVLGDNGALDYSKKRTEYRKLDQELQDLQKENERLQTNIKALRTDPKTIEREAREQLKYTRPGEVVYTLPTPAPTDTNTAKKQ
jgi:cell division protein FtsB